MTNEEINRAVAYAAGWMYHDGWHGPNGEADCLPDFANSYDAIMPLVKALKKGRENRFADHLFKAVFPHSHIRGWMFTRDMHEFITATPRQLCEAYLAVGGGKV